MFACAWLLSQERTQITLSFFLALSPLLFPPFIQQALASRVTRANCSDDGDANNRERNSLFEKKVQIRNTSIPLRRDSTLIKGRLLIRKIEGRRRRGDRGSDGWIGSPTQCTWVWANWKIVMGREVWHATVHGITKSRTWLSDWATTTFG